MSGRVLKLNAPLRLGPVKGFAIVALPAVVAGLTLSGCGGGGGGGGGATTTPAPPAPPSPPVSPPSPPVSPPSPPVAPPSPPATPTLPSGSYPTSSSAEYTRSYSLAQIGAATAFRYANGAGVTVAVIDDEVSTAAFDLSGRVSPQSTDLYSSRNLPGGDPWPTTGTDAGLPNHGTLVAGIVAADYNNSGTIGVAYDATILGVRADQSGCTSTSGCFFDNDLAAGINYAIAHGARVINLSLGGTTPDNTAFQNALLAAVNAGLVVTISAGNNSATDPDYPARYASDPRFTSGPGAVIAVGATNAGGGLASFSAMAGASANDYILAPGDTTVDGSGNPVRSQSLITGCDSSGSCWAVGGTSFSAPEVAGAVALLLQAFPNLTGRQAADILLNTATDLGATGADTTFGRGLLNLAAAFSPQGGLVVLSAGSPVQVALDALQAGIGSPAFGDALASAPLATVGYDSYQREFQVDLGKAFPQGRPAPLGAASAAPLVTTQVEAALPNGGRFSLAAQAPQVEAPPIPRPAAFGPQQTPRAVLAQARFGAFTFSSWSGAGGAPPAPVSGPRNAFETLAAADRIAAVSVQAGAWRLSTEQGSASPAAGLQADPLAGSRYASLSAYRQTALGGFKLSFGHLDEPRGVLGAEASAGSPYRMPAATDFASVYAEQRLGPGLDLTAEASLGVSRAQGPLLSLSQGETSSWRVALNGACGRFACDQFSLYAAQPLRLERGEFHADLPAVPDSYGGAAPLTARDFTASPSGREVDIGANLLGKAGNWGQASLSAAFALQPGSVRSAAPGYGFSAAWRGRF